MNISVVIPCYNEEKFLEACLSAIQKQTEQVSEIIVVDNNSTDRSAAIAKAYGAKVIKEERQGITPTRNRGFDEARGDIIARCDADTLVPPDWIERIRKDFETYHPDALTGLIKFYDYLLPTTFYGSVYLFLMKFIMKGHNTLQGPNMAISKTAWLDVRDRTCPDDKEVHEDIDLSIHLAMLGKKVLVDKDLVVEISGRRLKNNPLSFFVEYPKRLITTSRKHTI